jgi:hypothetical protein
MRHFIQSLLIAVLVAATLSTANAQIPRMFTYQGVVVDGTGKLISDGPHNLTLNLYTQATGSTAIYSENQTGVVFVKGIFNVMVGSVTTIPASLGFDKAYFLGVSVDGGAEMTPRTTISPSPYAIGLAGGAVNSINGKSGAVVIKAGTGTTLTTAGDTITLNSTGVGGNGIQGVSNADNSIAVANPTGPTASVSVAIGGITTTKLADQAVTSAKIDGTGITAGMILMANGLGGVSWQALGGGSGLTLPYTGLLTNGSTGISISNLGTGGAGSFIVSNAANPANALSASSNGNGASATIYGLHSGLGRSAFFEITNAQNSSDVLFARTAGIGVAIDASIINNANGLNALQGLTLGTGRAGFFQITNGANASNALEATTNGTGNGILGSTAAAGASGAGVEGKTTNNNGIGVLGLTADGGAGVSTNSAVMGSSGNGYGVEGSTSSGYGVEGFAGVTGIAIHGLVGSGGTTARAAVLEQNSATTTGNVLEATSKGTGIAGYFNNTNGNNGNPTLEAINASTNGNAIGIYGEISNSSSTVAIKGVHKGTTVAGTGVLGSHAGGGVGVYGTSVTGVGTEGFVTGDGVAILGSYGGASTSGTSLQVDNGYIKVSGATKSVYVHTVNANNLVAGRSFLSYPGMASTDMLIITHQFVAVALQKTVAGIAQGIAFGTLWNAAQNRWEIFLEDQATALPLGEKFNILVIKQ